MLTKQQVMGRYYIPRSVDPVQCHGEHWLRCLSNENTAAARVDLFHDWTVSQHFRWIIWLRFAYQGICCFNSNQSGLGKGGERTVAMEAYVFFLRRGPILAVLGTQRW